MTPLSRWKVKREDEEKIIKVLVNELTKVKSEEEMNILVQTLLTPVEQLMVAKRIFAFILIDQGIENTEIAKRLHFTRATVDRLKVVYRHMDEVKRPVKRLVKQFETSELVKDLLKMFINYAVPAAFGRIPR